LVSLSPSLSLSTVFLSSLSPTSGPRLGGTARPPAASLSPLHIAVPHAYSSLLARGWKGGRGGPSSAAPNRALASELAVEEGDEILHGRLLELAVEEEACAARRWSRARSAASSLPRLRPMAARAREGAGEVGSGVGTSLLSSPLSSPWRSRRIWGGARRQCAGDLVVHF